MTDVFKIVSGPNLEGTFLSEKMVAPRLKTLFPETKSLKFASDVASILDCLWKCKENWIVVHGRPIELESFRFRMIIDSAASFNLFCPSRGEVIHDLRCRVGQVV